MHAARRIDVPPNCGSACAFMCMFYLVVLIMLVAILTIVALVMPIKLDYTIERGSVRGFSLGGDDRLNATFHLVVGALNPGTDEVHYDSVSATVSYKQLLISSSNSVPPFDQPMRSQAHWDMYLLAHEAAVNGAVGRDLRREWAEGGIGLDVKIWADIWLKSFGVFKIHKKQELLCGPVVALPIDSSKSFRRVGCHHG